MDEEDLTLPEEEIQTDSKALIEEKKELTPEQKKRLETQSKFEYREIEGKEIRKEEEEKEEKKEILFKWIIGAGAVLFLIGLYFWLIY